MTNKRKLQTTSNEVPQNDTETTKVDDDSIQPKKLKLIQQNDEERKEELVVKKKEKERKRKKKDILTELSAKSKQIKKEKQKTKSVSSEQENNEVSANNAEFLKEVEQAWEKFADESNKDKIAENAEELYKLIKGRASELVYAEHTAKVFEGLMDKSLLALKEIRNSVYDELKDEIDKMSQSKYAKSFVLSVLRHGNDKQINEVIHVLTQHVVRLIKDNEAASVVETVFNEIAYDEQRTLMFEAICGQKDECFKETVMELIKKPVISHSLVHKVLRKYFEECDLPMKREVIDVIKKRLLEILHTLDGRHVAMDCIKHSKAKTRKVIIKSFAGYVTQVCKSVNGKVVIMAIFDYVDDVELIMEFIIEEMVKDLLEIISDNNGYVVIQYLLSRDRSDLNKEARKIKKRIAQQNVDRRHLLVRAVPFFAKFLADKPEVFLMNGHVTNFIMGLIANMDNCWQYNWDSLVKLVAEPYTSPSKCSSWHVIEDQKSNEFLMALLKHEKSLQVNSPSLLENHELFCEKLMRLVDPNNMSKWSECRRGASLLACMFEVGDKRTRDKLREILKPVYNELKASPFESHQLLIKLLTKTQDQE